jgi:hypothetical protein
VICCVLISWLFDVQCRSRVAAIGRSVGDKYNETAHNEQKCMSQLRSMRWRKSLKILTLLSQSSAGNYEAGRKNITQKDKSGSIQNGSNKLNSSTQEERSA